MFKLHNLLKSYSKVKGCIKSRLFLPSVGVPLLKAFYQRGYPNYRVKAYFLYPGKSYLVAPRNVRKKMQLAFILVFCYQDGMAHITSSLLIANLTADVNPLFYLKPAVLSLKYSYYNCLLFSNIDYCNVT